MKIEAVSCSNRGGRRQNQDKTAQYLGERSACFVLCDGVAGDAGGEQAAALACQFLLEHAQQDIPCPPDALPPLIGQLQRVITQAQQEDSTRSRMRTTLVSLFIDRDDLRAHWVHAGDSRLYLFRNGYLYCSTRDHSLTQKMKDAGYQTGGVPDNLLYTALGAGENHAASYSPSLALYDGDAFLLCSDGFWQRYNQALLEYTLRLAHTPAEWLTLIEDLSPPQPQQDNYSATAVWIGSPQETTLLQMLPLDDIFQDETVASPEIRR
ncbi:PP2C family protein-serine/threonine phosphatase [Enterobacillus tribolii]|uniref:Serine/threonine protein phosphatase PrpC n=1 Tax=Enterobacillus tribolii TaxID=1487935 RepID=A0A370QS52_9GAMM|nr:PP2C family serine/threonine-protein phosphatase [Enterobacillus tribolii]MBW7983736.1 serine/threonine-protein phosphatase [Enterobacillus tribolii]RDK92100.1 serine/threonine protein phosphatase PrpC [Enterobacillus tribolii]